MYDIPSLTKKFLDFPWYLDTGKGKLSKRFKVSPEEVEKAKALARDQIIRNKEGFPKILVLDIETAPMAAWVWGRWKQNIYLEQTMSEWFMISWAAKWLLSADVVSDKLTPSEILAEEDKRIIKSLWYYVDTADIIITHNGNDFDLPRINSRFIVNGFPPPSPFKSIDTKIISARQFGFSSNKLDALAGYFGFDAKLQTEFDLWKRCMKGDAEALKYMDIYCKHDVVLLEEIYLKLRPWMKSHPNLGLYLNDAKNVCSACGSESIKLIPDKYFYTQVTKYPLYRCSSCTAISRGRKTVMDKEVNKKLITSIPK